MIGFSIITLNGTDGVTPDDRIPPGQYAGEGQITKAFILQNGMQSGGTSISFYITQPDGKQILVQTSAALLNGLMSAVKGNEWRWEQEARSGKDGEDGY